MIYLRPTPSSKPVKYTESIEKAGLVVSGKHSIALYTCKSGAKQGPIGPPGEDQNSWFDTIIDAASDEFSPITVTAQRKSSFRCPYPLDLTSGYIRASLGTAPEGSAFIVDIHMNGTTMFSTLLHIDANTKTTVGSATPAVLSTTYCPDDAEFEVFVTQIGSVVAGAGLKVAITGIKTT